MDLIQQRIIGLRMGLNEKNYKIITHKEFKQLDIDFRFKYKDPTKVYYLISEEEAITAFVISEGKIISFFYGLIKTKTQPLGPWILKSRLI